MIAGLGIDLVETARIESVIERHGHRFLDHVFTAEEQAAAPGPRAAAIYYAGRWAAKEAVAKALGTGIGTTCAWHDIVVRRGPAGEPLVVLVGRGALTAAGLGVADIRISITHSGGMAAAIAVAERGP